MASPTIRIKRSAVSGKIPTAEQVPLGELALNTYDAKIYASKNVGVGTTVFVVNPWTVGLGTDSFDTYFTNGNVGVGVSPSRNLHVHDASASNVYLQLSNSITGSGTTDGFQLLCTATGEAALLQRENQPLSFYTNNTEYMRLDSSGRLCVGTYSANTSAGGIDISSGGIGLVIGADGNVSTRTDSTNKIFRIGSYHYTNSEEPICIAFGQNLSSENELNFGGGTSALNAATYIRFFTAANNTTTSGTERMRITSAGNVGIGTISPDTNSQLHIVGTSYQPVYCNTTFLGGGGAVFLNSGTQALYAGTAGSSWLTGSSTADGLIRAEANLIFATNGNNQRAQIDSSGRFLVGTSTARTDFFGSFAADVQVEGSGFAAYSCYATAGNGAFIFARDTPISGSTIGNLSWQADDGTDEVEAARISAQVDGTPGANDMPGRLVFSTTADGASSPTERMKLDNRGQLSLQSTTSTFDVATTQAAGTTYSTILSRHSATGGSPGTGTLSFRVYSNGDVQNTNNSYGAISDIKLKENIIDANSQWDDLKTLQVRKYNFKPETGHGTHTQIGLIAQEVELVSPGLVGESPDRDEDGNDLGTVTKSVNYSVLYMKAVKALQEAMERIETLEASNTDLLARVTALEAS